MNARTTRAGLGLMAAGAIAASTLLNAPTANASPESAFLDTLMAGGLIIYDASAALSTGQLICQNLNYANGQDVAQVFYDNSSSYYVPTIEVAELWVVAAAQTLCPWNWHPERLQPAPQQPQLQRAL